MYRYALILFACLSLPCFAGGAVPPLPAPYALVLTPGTPEELPYLAKIGGAFVAGTYRHADLNQFWAYGFRVAPGARCRLVLTLALGSDEAAPTVLALDQKARPLTVRTERQQAMLAITWTVPQDWQTGARMTVQIIARTAPCTVGIVQFSQIEPDTHGVGLPDNVITLLRQGLEPTARLNVMPRPAMPYTLTQSSQPPNPTIDLQTDAIFTDAVAPSPAGPILSHKDDGMNSPVVRHDGINFPHPKHDGINSFAVEPAAVCPSDTVETDRLLLSRRDNRRAAPYSEGIYSVVKAWKARGYVVWTMGGQSDGGEAAAQRKDEIQTTATGEQLTAGNSFYFTPTDDRLAIERAAFDAALAAGSEGICPAEPLYWARAGYDMAFKTAWQKQYGSPWQDPSGGIDARWKTGQLMATLETNQTDSLLQAVQQKQPNARRIVTLRSPLASAELGIVSPQARIGGLDSVQEIIGQVWPDTTRAPIRDAGLRRPEPFFHAYLEYAALATLARRANKRLWFLLDPLGDNPEITPEGYKADFEQTLIAALLFPDVDAYEIMPWPERVYGHISADYAIEINSVVAALQDIHTQNNRVSLANADVGLLLSDSMQWQRVGPNASDLDGVYGLALPLLERGIPVQILSLERAGDPGYLDSFKTLLLSYDFQKPLSARTQSALADWTRRGGSLLFFGGSDGDNALADSWWRQAKLHAPQDALWTQLGIPLKSEAQAEPPLEEDLNRYQPILFANGIERNLRNRQRYTIDLTAAAKQTGSVGVRFSSLAPKEDTGPYLASVEIRIGDQLAAAFRPGSEIENRFLAYDNGSVSANDARTATRNASWTYRFDNLPADQKITLTLDIGNTYLVAAGSVLPDLNHTLIGAAEGGALTKTFPRMRIGSPYVATVYPQITDSPSPSSPSPPTKGLILFRKDDGINSFAVEHDGINSFAIEPAAVCPSDTVEIGNLLLSRRDNRRAAPYSEGIHSVVKARRIRDKISAPNILYTLRTGDVAIWANAVERGLVVDVGVAPGYFSGSERSASFLRGLAQYACQRTGAPYREAGSFRLQRGRYTVIRTLNEPEKVSRRTIDLLSPSLAIAADRVIPPNSVALLYDPGAETPQSQIGFISGRLTAHIESSKGMALFVRGPLGTIGVARLLAGNRHLANARASDRWGRPLALQSAQEGDTVLLRYSNNPDGVILRLDWQNSPPRLTKK